MFWRLSMGIWMLISSLLSALSVHAPLSKPKNFQQGHNLKEEIFVFQTLSFGEKAEPVPTA